MASWIYNILDRFFVVAGAFFFLQIPQYFQQYTALLSGHLAELSYQIDLWERSAKVTGKSLPELVQKFNSSLDPDFSAQGAIMKHSLERLHTFKEAFQALQESSPLERPFLLIKYFNWQICQETFSQFHFGLPLNFEGLIYALIGIFAGYGVFFALSKLWLCFKGCFAAPKRV